MSKCPDGWQPACCCSITADEPSQDCYAHGFPDTKKCPWCGRFRGYICGCGYRDRNAPSDLAIAREKSQLLGKQLMADEEAPCWCGVSDGWRVCPAHMPLDKDRCNEWYDGKHLWKFVMVKNSRWVYKCLHCGEYKND